jgi:hypothetical protein
VPKFKLPTHLIGLGRDQSIHGNHDFDPEALAALSMFLIDGDDVSSKRYGLAAGCLLGQ